MDPRMFPSSAGTIEVESVNVLLLEHSRATSWAHARSRAGCAGHVTTRVSPIAFY